jgi:hypothetical protein
MCVGETKYQLVPPHPLASSIDASRNQMKSLGFKEAFPDY